MRPPLTEEHFRRILEHDLGLTGGVLLFVHSSTNNMNLAFPVQRILAILRDVIGPEGTLVFPSWNQGHTGIFDVRATPTDMGLIAELARRLPGGIRSLHPQNSMLAVGPQADLLTRDHTKSRAALDQNSPLHRLASMNGTIVGLGVTSSHLSLIHCPESIWLDKFPCPRFTTQTRHLPLVDREGRVIEVEVYERTNGTPPDRNIRAYLDRHFPPSIVRDFTVSGTPFFWCDGKSFLERVDELTRQGITMYDGEGPAQVAGVTAAV